MNRYWFVFALTLVQFVAFSCTKLEEQDSTSKSNGNENLVEQLTQTNQELLKNRVQTRGFLEVLCIATADIGAGYELGKIGLKVGSLVGPKGAIVGAGVLGLIGAVGGSYGAYRGLYGTRGASADLRQVIATYYQYQQMGETSKYLDHPINLHFPDDATSRCVLFGRDHNALLSMLEDNSNNTIARSSGLDDFTEAIISSKDFTEAYDFCVCKAKTASKQPYSVNDKKGTGDRVVNLFLEIYMKYPNSQHDVDFIVNKYIEIIAPSTELTQEEKDIIFSSLSVAAYSFKHWSKKLKSGKNVTNY